MRSLLLALALSAARAAALQFRVSLPPSSPPALGRVRVYLTRGECGDTPPSAQCSDDQETSQAFGVDTPAGGLKPGDSVVVDKSVTGYPLWSTSDVRPGKYCVQADLARYKVYPRASGNVTLPESCVSDGGNDGAYGAPPGTLYGDPKAVTIGGDTVELTLEHEVKPVPPPGCTGTGGDSKWIKSVSVDSELLKKFWGVPMRLEACVLLPMGFDEHPDAQYPLVLAHGHYSAIFTPGGAFSETPPSPNATGYTAVDENYAYYLYRNWSSASGPFHGARALVATVNHPVPFFDDSYAVDSANVGPYGSAIMRELVPAIEKRFRGIGAGWARGVLGGSTGGWESFAVQVLYPDDFNYAAVACPDPIAFSSYTTIDLYKDSNAYDAPFKKTARPGVRDHYSGTTVLPGTSTPAYGHPYGQTTATVEEMNRREIVLGARSRSCGQWDIWEAVFGPQGADNYPERIWCKDPAAGYGAVNASVVNYMRDHFDMLHRVRRDWSSGLGAKLNGKLHVFVGASDTFFLTNAVMDLEDWSKDPTLDPPFDGEIVVGAHGGRGYEHCFNGFLPDGTPAPNAITRELYVTKFLPRMAERWASTAPKGANMEWHQY